MNQSLTQMLQIPQIWHDYMLDPDAARAQREKATNAHVRKKAQAAETRKQKAAAKKAAANGTQEQVAPQTQPASTTGEQSHNTGQKRRRNVMQNRDINGGPGEEEDEEDEDEDPLSCLHPDDPANFLKLCRALRILVAREVTEADITEASILLQEYCSELIKVRSLDSSNTSDVNKCLAIWPQRYEAQSSLCHSHSRLCSGLWSSAWVLDISF